jgi:ZIP family zinc transporter
MTADLPYTTFVAVILLASLSVLTTLVGVALAVFLRCHAFAVALGIGFSAGIMLLISLFELIPEATAHAGIASTSIAAIFGMGIVAVLHAVIPHKHLVEEKGAFYWLQLRTAYLVAFGLILHDVPEGFAMANSYIASPSMGVLVALGIALHNIPEEFAMAVPIVAVKKKRLLFAAAFLSGLAEPVGAICGLVAVAIHPGLNAIFMAVAAGAMIFVSVHELLPLAKQYGKIHLFAIGALFSTIVYALLGTCLPG